MVLTRSAGLMRNIFKVKMDTKKMRKKSKKKRLSSNISLINCYNRKHVVDKRLYMSLSSLLKNQTLNTYLHSKVQQETYYLTSINQSFTIKYQYLFSSNYVKNNTIDLINRNFLHKTNILNLRCEQLNDQTQEYIDKMMKQTLDKIINIYYKYILDYEKNYNMKVNLIRDQYHMEITKIHQIFEPEIQELNVQLFILIKEIESDHHKQIEKLNKQRMTNDHLKNKQVYNYHQIVLKKINYINETMRQLDQIQKKHQENQVKTLSALKCIQKFNNGLRNSRFQVHKRLLRQTTRTKDELKRKLDKLQRIITLTRLCKELESISESFMGIRYLVLIDKLEEKTCNYRFLRFSQYLFRRSL
ncbi:unnamed protein product [Didymodactylos carnosus]|uniref:Uncharacterized protein n=1 Tax=Didymodactylos carnosus TaxID=1234261 RepID=A0A8S2UFJ6_9BILA|nr:unnamed protein product [Didymodactylos carnosus]CAF4332786.1 unnamed protein product [Didymodactylos carnosus]